jgi:RNA recognition motif-containing protein
MAFSQAALTRSPSGSLDDIDFRKIFCGNISFVTDDEALFCLFRAFGEIDEVGIEDLNNQSGISFLLRPSLRAPLQIARRDLAL